MKAGLRGGLVNASLAGRLAGAANGEMSRRFAEKAQAQLRDADVIRQILLAGGVLARADAGGIGDAIRSRDPNDDVS
jgi:hypothetical protein